MRATIDHGDLEIGIDGWGGVYFDWSECDDVDESLALSPAILEEIEMKRHAVLDGELDEREEHPNE